MQERAWEQGFVLLPRVHYGVHSFDKDTDNPNVARFQYHAHTESEPDWIWLVLSPSGWFVRLPALL